MNTEVQEPPVKILLAPLDWGLGHATRCIPLVQRLTAFGCQVILAGDGRIKTLLKREFPDLPFLDLPGYKIEYPGTQWKMPFKIAAQIPQILQSINEEHEWLQKAAQENEIEGIISDNRYGLFHPVLPTVFITHQLRIQTHLGSLANDILQRWNYSYIKKFSFCWVPDHEGGENLGGDLSHPEELPGIPVRYTGPLSRCQSMKPSTHENVLIILSGPEPQRTVLEDLLIEEIKEYKNRITVVRGLPGEIENEKKFPLHAEVHQHLSAEELVKKIDASSIVISRCGYSTVMDLAAMKKQSILIPTPGQTEQEYLAKHLMDNNYALCIKQEKFRLSQALNLAQHFRYRAMPTINEEKMDKALKEFVGNILKYRSHKK